VVFGCTGERQALIRTLHIEFPFVAQPTELKVAKLLAAGAGVEAGEAVVAVAVASWI